MITSILVLILGIVVLVAAADRFVAGSAATARYLGAPPLLIGMVVIGFGTSAPELLVSALAALDGRPGVALGNAYGSNVANIGLILGVAALVAPIVVRSQVVRREIPILAAATAVAALLLVDGHLTRLDAGVLLGLFAALLAWSIVQSRHDGRDPLASDTGEALARGPEPTRAAAATQLVLGLVVLIAASRALVWAAVRIAEGIGIPDLIVGLTIVAVGTSLPELASSLAAARKGEHDLALGNVLGSNLFNTLAVVGLAAMLRPMQVAPEILQRDVVAMAVATLVLLIFGLGRRQQGRINRVEGGLLVVGYLAYLGWLAIVTVQG